MENSIPAWSQTPSSATVFVYDPLWKYLTQLIITETETSTNISWNLSLSDYVFLLLELWLYGVKPDLHRSINSDAPNPGLQNLTQLTWITREPSFPSVLEIYLERKPQRIPALCHSLWKLDKLVKSLLTWRKKIWRSLATIRHTTSPHIQLLPQSSNVRIWLGLWKVDYDLGRRRGLLETEKPRKNSPTTLKPLEISSRSKTQKPK